MAFSNRSGLNSIRGPGAINAAIIEMNKCFNRETWGVADAELGAARGTSGVADAELGAARGTSGVADAELGLAGGASGVVDAELGLAGCFPGILIKL